MEPLPEGLVRGEDGRVRCWWQGGQADYLTYHDEEWGRPQADDRRLFEKLCLEGFQSGLSWLTILRKRRNFRSAFADFDFARVARFDATDIARLLADPGIVRHRGKIEAAVSNAARAVEAALEAGSLAAFLWRYAPPLEAPGGSLDQAGLRARTTSPAATDLARELRRRGWRFVGPTTVYAFMQATGMVNDHLDGCWCRAEVEGEQRAFRRPGG